MRYKITYPSGREEIRAFKNDKERVSVGKQLRAMYQENFKMERYDVR